nr:metallophosphoesterase [Eubacterium sp.]
MSNLGVGLIPIGLVGMAAEIYAMVKFYQLWKRFGLVKFLYWVLQFALNCILGVCLCRVTLFENEIVKSSLLRVSALYFVFMLYSTVLILLRQLVCVIGKRYQWKNRCYKFIRSTKRGVGSILVFSFVISVVALFWAQYRSETTYVLDGFGESMKMTVVSDAHIGTAVLRSDLPEIVEEIQATKPDIIFILGDMFDHNTSEALRQATVKAFSKLSAPYGVFYVEGNHEAKFEEDTAGYFRKAGIQVLLDQVTTLPNGVQIAGRRDFSDEEQLSLETVLSGTDKERPLILLSHQPQEYKEAEKLGVDLVVSGHTHGGQFFGNVLTYLGNDMNYGMKKLGNMTAITSSGVGAMGVPAKLGVPNEVVVVEVK